MRRVAVVGGGAAGFFFAANAGREQGTSVEIFEAAPKPLRKVLASGAGRCNLANSLEDIESIISNYPRGGGFLRKVFRAFSPKAGVMPEKWNHFPPEKIVFQSNSSGDASANADPARS